MGDSGNVPRVAGHGARKEGAGVAGEVGDNQFHELLGKPGYRRRAQGRYLRGTSKEQLLDFGLASPPYFGSEQFKRYCGGDATR